MKSSASALTAAFVTWILVFPSSAVIAAPELSVDFGRVISGNPTPVQPGFSGMAGDPVQATKTEAFGPYTVTVQGEGFYSAGFNAGNVDAAVAPLYEDYYYHNSPVNGVGISLSIAGISPNTDYFLTLWSYDEDNIFTSTDTLWSPAGNTAGTSGSIVNFATPFPTDFSFNRTKLRVSSTTTTLDVFGTTTAGQGGTRINGFQLSLVPEPSAGIIAMIGCMAIPGTVRRIRPRR